MRIAVSTETNVGLDAPVAGHFGGCPFFTLIDLQADQVQAVQVVANPYLSGHEPGEVPQFVHSQGAKVVLARAMGQRAVSFFEQYRIQPMTGVSGTVRQAVEAYLQGQLSYAAPCHDSAHVCGDEHDHGHHGA
jgi:predicted Fe-Mo cluster-binding NifX family protein